MNTRIFPTPLLGVVLFFIAISVSAQNVHVRTSHTDSIERTVVLDDTYLITGGKDGKLIVWEVETERLLRSIHADFLPIQEIVPYPDGDRLAVYASDGQTHRITVWNWRTGEREFLHFPDDEVLHLDVSSQGSYLIYALPELRSLRVVDGKSGRLLPFLRENTGIVSWFVIARSEERVMTYTPSTGEIVYRTIVTGQEVRRFSGPTGLIDPILLPTPRFAAAVTREGKLAVIDLLSGSIVAETVAGDINQLALDSDADEIVVISTDYGGSQLIRRYRFTESGNDLQRRYTPRREIPDGISNMAFIDRDIFAGDTQGRVLRWLSFETNPQTIAENKILSIKDILVEDDTMHILTGEEIVSITSDLFQTRTDTDSTTYVRDRITRLPRLEDDLEINSFVNGAREAPLIVRQGAQDDGLVAFDSDRYRFDPLPITLPDSFLSIAASGDEVLFLSRSGRVEVIDTDSGVQTFSYRGRGLQTAILTSRGIFLGKAADGILDTSVLRVDPRTGETVPIDTATDLVFYLSYDSRRGRLFTIGIIKDRPDGPSTVIEIFEGATFQRRRTILEFDGEYLDAMVTVDPLTGNAYTTLDDRGGILRWDGSRVSELARSPSHIPRSLHLTPNHILSVNRDGTLSIVDRVDGVTVLDLSFIDDYRSGSWIAIGRENWLVVSRDYLATPSNISIDENLRRSIQSLQVRVPERPERSSGDDSRDRFDSGLDPDEEEQPWFNPFGDEPAPSS